MMDQSSMKCDTDDIVAGEATQSRVEKTSKKCDTDDVVAGEATQSRVEKSSRKSDTDDVVAVEARQSPVRKSSKKCDTDDVVAGVATTVDDEMRRVMMAASYRSANPELVRNFLVLNSPRIHGSAELLLQYESAYRQQCHFLQESKSTWASFWSKSARPKTEVSQCEKRRVKKGYYWRPPETYQPVKYNTSPHRACILHTRHTTRSSTSSEEDFFKNSSTKTSLKSTTSQNVTSQTRQPIRLPPIEELDRYETDYEPIEQIARRNQLNLNINFLTFFIAFCLLSA
ncbi:hypothetical protein Btru_039996 [Bulinus truncatus]|nr:hypothetical protein Btru_039996 [Bulinus truncatus]